MTNQQEHDTYIIPPNFIDTGTFFGGLFKARNVIEAGIVSAAIGLPIIFCLPYSLTARIVILCLTVLPLALAALIGIDGESLSAFLLDFLRFCHRRRIVGGTEEERDAAERRYHSIRHWLRKHLHKRPEANPADADIDNSEDIPPLSELESGEAVEDETEHWRDRLAGLLRKGQFDPSLDYMNPVSGYLPIQKIENGIVHTKDGRYLKIVEVEPINFLLRSAAEQRGIVYSFLSWLKISPVKLQFKVPTRRAESTEKPLAEKVREVTARALIEGRDADHIPAPEFFAPRSIDLTHGSYVCIDGLYYAWLLVPSDGYRAQVPAGWLSLLVNAGDGIDLDFFLERQPKERIIQKVGQQLRINRSRLKDASDTNTDFDDLDSAIQSGYFLKQGLANNEDFFSTSRRIAQTSNTQTAKSQPGKTPAYGLTAKRIPGKAGHRSTQPRRDRPCKPGFDIYDHMNKRRRFSMATKKKDESTQETGSVIQDVETPLTEQTAEGPPEVEDISADTAVSDVEDAEGCLSDPAATEADAEEDTDPESVLDIFVEEPPAVEDDAGTAQPESAAPTEEDAQESPQPVEPPAPAKPKRASRKKKAASEPVPVEAAPSPSDLLGPEAPLSDEETTAPPEAAPESSETEPEMTAPKNHTAAAPRLRSSRPARPSILTIENGDVVETQADREDVIWHEIHNAYRVRRVLTGQFCGVEQTENGKTLAIADYKGFRVVIPLREMLIEQGGPSTGKQFRDEMQRLNRLLGNMLGAEIDFVIRGIASAERKAVASRRDAMLRKRQTFYFGTDAEGMYRIHEGRIVQARVIAVAEKVIRVEAFGVECSIPARDLAWDWMGDAHERYAVGDKILIRIQFDYRTPGKHDDVSFVVTAIDEERGVATGIITRIIRQNL